MIYPLVKEMAAVGAPVRVPVAVACRILGFSKQAYYKWLRQPVSAREAEERELIAVLRELHADDPEGGYRVLADDITELGYTVSERRVWRLCRVAGIQSVIVTRTSRYKKAGSPVHDDLVQRQFTAEGPNQLWLTDITEHRTREGKVYLCAIKDVFSNRIVGYSIDSRMKARIAVNALEMAVTHRGQPAGVIVHSDRGSQFRSRKFCKALKRHGLRGSMGRVGACGDNAAMESFFALLQKNVLDRQPWTTRHELRLEIVSWIEGKYHRKRRQRRLGKLTPIEYESSTTPPLHWRHNPGGQPNLQQTPSDKGLPTRCTGLGRLSIVRRTADPRHCQSMNDPVTDRTVRNHVLLATGQVASKEPSMTSNSTAGTGSTTNPNQTNYPPA